MEVCQALIKQNSKFFVIKVTTFSEQEGKNGSETNKKADMGEIGVKDGACLKKCHVVKLDI